MTEDVRNEFRSNAVLDEETARHLAYLASQDNGSVLTGGFRREGAMLDREGNDRARQQAATAMEFLTQQEQLRQERLATLASRFDALELAARDALTEAENDLANILSNANRDRSGRAVFRDEHGDFRNEEGQIVDPADVDMSEWDSDAASWETVVESKAAIERATETYDRVRDVRTRFDGRDFDDQDLDALEDDLDALEAEISALESAELTGEPETQQPAIAATDPAAVMGVETSPFKPR